MNIENITSNQWTVALCKKGASFEKVLSKQGNVTIINGQNVPLNVAYLKLEASVQRQIDKNIKRSENPIIRLVGIEGEVFVSQVIFLAKNEEGHIFPINALMREGIRGSLPQVSKQNGYNTSVQCLPSIEEESSYEP